ncbi:hypothetical protein HS088_TW10G00468 [Tripterygium wilfordii]|uniref:Receptor-like serine/threonine-protein kinase n=1 Tax=Tripterygium wilfordii TaxID=458696 RepID=A0A7J7D585_TRIWF|nr:G-type lectin S-receptor-like serine/threonine-protein kinase At2g19130 [Tripterygium wilfordii]KAF5741471.1 hypothetical protein HS088_TW10G00468 [Tripterygium wilfordii]
MDANNNPWFLVFVIFMYFSLNFHHSFGADTISGNQYLSGDRTLVSAGGDFVLGFFKPVNSSNYYIGMWYGKVSTKTIVWVANRDRPISDILSSELRISDGNLVLFDESSSPIWSTSLESTSSSPVEAALLDDGNLVLRDGSNSTDLLWQSFYHPTDTWLPGGRLRLNGGTKNLISWKNEQDPASGLFSFALGPNELSQYYGLIWFQIYWSNKIFGGVYEMTPSDNYYFSYVTNDYEYLTFSMKDKSIISRFVMDVSGRIQLLTWLESSKEWNLFWSQPRQPCEVFYFCGAFGNCNNNSHCTCSTGFEPKSKTDWDLQDYSGGCERKTSLQSGSTSLANGKSDIFSVSPNVKLVRRLIVGSVGAVVFLVILGIIYIRHRMRRSIKVKAVEGSLLAFGFKYLQNATKNFSEKLGGGGFGSVFKGVLPDSTVIAVKKLESVSQGEKQFRTEVTTIGMIQHFNLVRLRGFCSEGNRKLLVYDYMPNGSLDSHLFHEKNLKVLDWKTRYQIALGTARGLTYLHEKCRDCIIHCDIKPENILLDAEFCPKVADFGLAKLVGREFSKVLTTMRGTRGYLAPEWISGVAITAKADVYSYGMMILELVSGERNAREFEAGKVKFFPTWAANQIIQGGDILSLLDRRLEKNADVEELTRVCKVACWCIHDDETCRPSMGKVVQILEGVVDVSMPPLPRSLQMFDDNDEHIIFFTESSSSQSSPQSSTSTASSQPKSTISSTGSTTQLDQ